MSAPVSLSVTNVGAPVVTAPLAVFQGHGAAASTPVTTAEPSQPVAVLTSQQPPPPRVLDHR
ncbi:hypothetical protein GN958_ATG07431 [Phytophthora infestans]|uniref:Uncharacterized protein n=1 Tax=Phytophthora infestans TaxID=4787 RepID=A0A8S9UR20_PHYIN|nr:hypothetical protein GN958_ATG07431 [Phytophthora infestans]